MSELGKVDWYRILWREEAEEAKLGITNATEDKGEEVVLQVGDRYIPLWESEVKGLAQALYSLCRDRLDYDPAKYHGDILPF